MSESKIVAAFHVQLNGKILEADGISISRHFNYTQEDADQDAQEPFRTITRFQAIKNEAIKYFQSRLLLGVTHAHIEFTWIGK